MFEEGVERWKQGDDRSAREIFDRVLQMDPFHAEALESIGVLEGKAGHHEKALEMFIAATKADPGHLRARTNLAFALKSLGQYEAALKAIDKVLQLDPQDPLATATRHDILRVMPRPHPAMQMSDYFEEAQSIHEEQCGQDRCLLSTNNLKPLSLHPEDSTLQEIQAVGQMFALMRLSRDSVRNERVHSNFAASGFGGTTHRPYVAGVAVDMLSMKIPSKDSFSEKAFSEMGSRMRSWGVVVLPNVVADEVCDAAQIEILKALSSPDYGMSNIYGSGASHRYDYPLLIDGKPKEILTSVVAQLEPLLMSMLGPRAVLAEFSALATFPGAVGQHPHSDSGLLLPNDIQERALLYSVFVYLDDVNEHRAALDVWPGTHSWFHFREGVDHHRWPAVRMAVPKGSVVIMDSRLLHGGSANTDQKPRIALYFSVLADAGSEPLGSTFTLRHIYEDAILLKHILNGIFPEKHRRGRFCFGNLNSAGNHRVKAHYMFPACTQFKFPMEREYTVDAIYDHDKEKISIWVDGEKEMEESRYLQMDDGPVSTHGACHSVHHDLYPFHGTVQEIFLATPEPKDIHLESLIFPPKTPMFHIALSDKESKIKQQFSSRVSLTNKSVRVRALVWISSEDVSRLHAIFVAGGEGSNSRPRWQADCIGTAMILGWSYRRQELLSMDTETTNFVANDAKQWI